MQSKNLLEKVFSGWDNLPLCGLVQPENQTDRPYSVASFVLTVLICFVIGF
jgi:hypothetical protein